MQNRVSGVAAVLVVGLVPAAWCDAAEPEWGTVKGRVVVAGDIPNFKPLVQKGANIKDAACCAAQDIADESFVIDPETNGFANVVVYLTKRPTKVHPDLERREHDESDPDKKRLSDEVKLTQKDCRYVPHILFAQVGQAIRVINEDPIAHNYRIQPVKNPPRNIVLVSGNPNGIVLAPIEFSERTPIKIACDIHLWMSAYCVALDHPYCAITDKTGAFEIEKLPAGRHEFVVWHESSGYLVKKLAVSVEKDINELDTLVVELDSKNTSSNDDKTR